MVATYERDPDSARSMYGDRVVEFQCRLTGTISGTRGAPKALVALPDGTDMIVRVHPGETWIGEPIEADEILRLRCRNGNEDSADLRECRLVER
jgi:hypothetical protein